MKKNIYHSPQTEIVSLSANIMQIDYTGGTTSGGGINTANQGVFDEDEGNDNLPDNKSSLWDE